jgi:hypothetical protein
LYIDIDIIGNGCGAPRPLNPLSVGEYIRSPQSGRASGLGETMMGARSYVPGECAENIANKVGEGGKWTCGEFAGDVSIVMLDENGNGFGESASGAGRFRMERGTLSEDLANVARAGEVRAALMTDGEAILVTGRIAKVGW